MQKKIEILEKTSTIIVIFNMIVFFFLFIYKEINNFAYDNVNIWIHNEQSGLWFTISYIVLTILILYFVPKKISLFFYGIVGALFILLGLSQILHFKIMGAFFDFNTLFLVNEGKHYFWYALKLIDKDLLLYIIISFTILGSSISLFMLSEPLIIRKNKYLVISVFLIFFLFIRLIAIGSLGSMASNEQFDVWNKPKNIYMNYSNVNKSMQISGLFEYTIRDLYLSIKDTLLRNKKDLIKEINEYVKNKKQVPDSNEYTSYFKDKNLIFIMLESVDNWLVTDEDMPTLSYMAKTGINFTNRYAPVFGGGRTFNSEFAANTGLYVPNAGKAIYDFVNNSFPYSLPSLFKKAGYKVNSIHYNTGDYYNRSNMHKTIGYTNHYSLYDMGIKANLRDDRILANNNDVYNLIVPDKGKFMTFIITVSTHLPYQNNTLCSKESDSLDCIKELSNVTDEFLRILLERLENDQKLNNTVIVLFTDHYAYGYDKKYLSKVKQTSDINLLQKTPFIIWGKDIEAKNVDTIMDTADIMPTLANMFGLPFNPNHYIGTDVFSNNHELFVYFNDYSWYDSNLYYQGQQLNDQEKYISYISKQVVEKIKINNNILYSDYYK